MRLLSRSRHFLRSPRFCSRILRADSMKCCFSQNSLQQCYNSGGGGDPKRFLMSGGVFTPSPEIPSSGTAEAVVQSLPRSLSPGIRPAQNRVVTELCLHKRGARFHDRSANKLRLSGAQCHEVRVREYGSALSRTGHQHGTGCVHLG